MMLYLSVDSGGTKTAAILFDGKIRALYSEAVPFSLRNCGRSVAPPEELFAMFRRAFAALDRPAVIDEIFVVDGDPDLILSLLPEGVVAKKTTFLGESLSGLLAGKLSRTGFLTVAGTGADAFYLEDGKCRSIVGGLGPIIGDEGSGTWIGREALAAASRYRDGWGDQTVLWHLICEQFGLDEGRSCRQLIVPIYENEQPFRVVASLVRLTAKAAEEGDRVAVGIYARAADLLARQTAACIRGANAPDDKTVVLCGGIFKSYAGAVPLFTEALGRYAPGYRVELPLFEHVVAGAVEVVLRQGTDDPETVLRNSFPTLIRRKVGE